MSPLDPLLVPYDGSVHAQAAAIAARLLAGPTGARTRLFHAIAPKGDLGDRVERAAHADETLNEEARRFATPVEVVLVDGDPGPAVALEAEKSGLTIVGTRGRSITAGLLLGSVARYLLRSVSRPVLAVHSPLAEVRRVVVGVDASPRSAAVVTTARALADATGARMVLVHVVDADPNVARSPEAFGVAANVWDEAVKAHAEDVFRPLRALAGGADERVEYGVAAERLRAVAKAERAEVVAVGRKGSSGRDVDAWFSVAFSLAVQGPFATLVV